MTIPVFVPPLGMTYPITRSPKWSNFHQEAVSGQDNPVSPWSYPRWQYKVPFSFLRPDQANQELQYVAAFYNLCQGSYGVFAYDDPDDDSVTAWQFAIGDGATVTFQLTRPMGPVGTVHAQPIFAVHGTPTVYVNGTPTSVTFNTGGTVTFSVAPANGAALTWTGLFYWLCRFDKDQLDFEQMAFGGTAGLNLWELKEVTFTTIKY